MTPCHAVNLPGMAGLHPRRFVVISRYPSQRPTFAGVVQRYCTVQSMPRLLVVFKSGLTSHREEGRRTRTFLHILTERRRRMRGGACLDSPGPDFSFSGEFSPTKAHIFLRCLADSGANYNLAASSCMYPQQLNNHCSDHYAIASAALLYSYGCGVRIRRL